MHWIGRQLLLLFINIASCAHVHAPRLLLHGTQRLERARRLDERLGLDDAVRRCDLARARLPSNVVSRLPGYPWPTAASPDTSNARRSSTLQRSPAMLLVRPHPALDSAPATAWTEGPVAAISAARATTAAPADALYSGAPLTRLLQRSARRGSALPCYGSTRGPQPARGGGSRATPHLLAVSAPDGGNLPCTPAVLSIDLHPGAWCDSASAPLLPREAGDGVATSYGRRTAWLCSLIGSRHRRTTRLRHTVHGDGLDLPAS